MITSSLPPELKVLIASGFLLAGGLLALRYPADHEPEEPIVAQTVEGEHSAISTSTTPPEQASLTSQRGVGGTFEPIADFVRNAGSQETTPTRSLSGDWVQTSMPESGNTPASDSMSRHGVKTSTLDRASYAEMPVNSTSEQETPPKPEYRPFQVTSPMSMPDANPAFFAEPPLPPNLSGIGQASDVGAGIVISPSTTMTLGASVPRAIPVETPRISPRATSPFSSTTLARPVIPKSDTQESVRQLTGSPIVTSAEKPRGDVITAPARTVIVPNPVNTQWRLK